jgi:hypothetical protein
MPTTLFALLCVAAVSACARPDPSFDSTAARGQSGAAAVANAIKSGDTVGATSTTRPDTTRITPP